LKKPLRIIVIVSVLAGLLAAGCAAQAEGTAPIPPKERMQVATTTSLYDTGLWGYLEPMFEEEYDIELDVLYAGTGIALEYGRRGDVDIINRRPPQRPRRHQGHEP